MAKSARAAMGVADLTVIADRGYFKGEEILACHAAGIGMLDDDAGRRPWAISQR